MSYGTIDASSGPHASSRLESEVSAHEQVPSSFSPIHRSATFTQVPSEHSAPKFPIRTDSIRRSLSENVIAVAVTTGSGDELDSRLRKDKSKSQGVNEEQDVSLKRRRSSRNVVPKFTIGAEQSAEDSADESRSKEDGGLNESEYKRRSFSGSITKLARRSWINSSRSPSPAPNRRRSYIESKSAPAHNYEDQSSAKQSGPEITPTRPSEGLTRRPSLLARKSKQQIASLINRKSIIDTPVPPIPKSYSTEKLPSLKHKASNLSDVPAVPSSTSSFERLQNAKIETPRKRDELWSGFRNLDGEFHKCE